MLSFSLRLDETCERNNFFPFEGRGPRLEALTSIVTGSVGLAPGLWLGLEAWTGSLGLGLGLEACSVGLSPGLGGSGEEKKDSERVLLSLGLFLAARLPPSWWEGFFLKLHISNNLCILPNFGGFTTKLPG